MGNFSIIVKLNTDIQKGYLDNKDCILYCLVYIYYKMENV